MLAQKIKVLIADDHIIFRRGLKMLLASIDGIELVGEAENGLDLLAVAGRYTPDVFLIDISMPVMDGVTAIREIRKMDTNIPIIVLSASNHQEEIDAAFKEGANEFLRKPVSSWELYTAMAKFL